MVNLDKEEIYSLTDYNVENGIFHAWAKKKVLQFENILTPFPKRCSGSGIALPSYVS